MIMKYAITFFTPLITIVSYLTLTIILYAFGPFAWETSYPVIWGMLNIAYIVAFVFGWYVGIKNKSSVHVKEWTCIDTRRIIKYLNPMLLINLTFELINLFRRFAYHSFDINGLMDDILYGFLNPGNSYNIFQDKINILTSEQVLGGYVMTIFNYIWKFVSFIVVLLGIFYFKRLKWHTKMFMVITCIVIIAGYISTGTNIGVFRLILAIFIFFWLKITRNKIIYGYSKYKKKMMLIFVISIVLMTILFNNIMQSRGGILSWNESTYNIGGVHLDKESIFFKILPNELHMLLVSSSSYLTQGYYGMSLCLNIEWMPTFGVGHSMALVKFLSKYVSETTRDRTYQHRLTEFGWEEDVRWHSMYSWFANDVSFIGVIWVMFFIGVIFAMAYKESILTNNPFAHLLVYYFSLMAFFIPCNNQIFQSTYTMFSFITAMFLWMYTRSKKAIRQMK